MTYRTKCLCEYHGGDYAGWQYQTEDKSIQNTIQEALYRLYGEEITAHASGRTDAGVHALGQVFHFTVSKYRTPEVVTQALNSMLPKDIVILCSEDVPLSFHARKSATGKTYLYRILNRPVRTALETGRVWYRRSPVDVKRLAAILTRLEGEHDFASFCVKKSLKENTVRRILSTEVRKEEDIIELRITGNGFLHNMVRIITGTAVELALSGGTPDDMARILDARNRDEALVTAPASGLYLEKVYYG